MDIVRPPPAPSNTFIDGTSPYLLLDVRDSDEFELCHIISGIRELLRDRDDFELFEGQ